MGDQRTVMSAQLVNLMAAFSLLSVCAAVSPPRADFKVEANPRSSERAFSRFDRLVDANGIGVYGERGVSDDKLLYVARVLTELLDNDEDGQWDDPAVVAELLAAEAMMPVFKFEGSRAEEAFADNYQGRGVSAVLYDDEVEPRRPGLWGTDATIEETLHTINAVGHAEVYPDLFGLEPGSSALSRAMDKARGGQFLSVPSNYPRSAWYHYYDRTCDYECMAIEYLYWAQVAHLGLINDRATCEGIADEWELCTADKLKQKDSAMHAVLVQGSPPLPQRAPDGKYAPGG